MFTETVADGEPVDIRKILLCLYVEMPENSI